MAIITYPIDIIPTSQEWKLVTNTQVFSSQLSNDVSTVELPGTRWKSTLKFEGMLPEESRKLLAFLASCRGMVNKFYLPDFSTLVPLGDATTSGIFNSLVSNVSINTSGWSPTNTSTLLKAGDFIKISTTSGVNELKIVVQNVAASSGAATITFEPPLRGVPTPSSTISIIDSNNLLNTSCLMRLESDNEINMETITSASISDLTINCVEAFR